jgi:two-component system CheB/CheR fusion protein
MGGLAIADQLQSQPEGQRIILVAITGRGTNEDREQTARAGFAAHLVKPIRIEELEATLEKVLLTPPDSSP